MRAVLVPHPDSACAALTGLSVEIERPRGDVLEIRCLVDGDIAALVLPPLAEPVRVDGLWRGTCFEVFVRTEAGDGYCELNFSPSTQWAAYWFDGYREGMREAGIEVAPHIQTSADPERLEVRVVANLAGVELLANAPWRLGLSAVIEEASGAKSYWALAHAPGKPDFHHPDCFALELPTARQA